MARQLALAGIVIMVILGMSGAAVSAVPPVQSPDSANVANDRVANQQVDTANETTVHLETLHIQNLTLNNVVIQNGSFQNVSPGSQQAAGGTQTTTEAAQQQYQNVSFVRAEVSGYATNVTLHNVTIRNDNVTQALFGSSANATRSVTEATLSNITITGLVAENTNVNQFVIQQREVVQQGSYAPLIERAGPPAVEIGTATADRVVVRNSSVRPGDTRPGEG